MPQSRDEVQQLFQSGVDAISTVTDRFSDQDWAQPACGSWSARQTATHVLGVVDWYHQWLDRAIEDERSQPFSDAEIDERAERDVQRFADLSGPEAIQRFRRRAEEYLQRTTAHWNTTYAYPFGVVTTGLHCGVAATEWHLHAWDLATSTSIDYEPPNPRSLLIAAASCVAVAEGSMKGALIRGIVPLASHRTPWKTLLRQSGRNGSSTT